MMSVCELMKADCILRSSAFDFFFEDFLTEDPYVYNGPLRQYFSLYRAVSQTDGGRSKNAMSEKCPNDSPCTYCRRSRPLLNYNLTRHWNISPE